VADFTLDGTGRPTAETRGTTSKAFGWSAAGRLKSVAVTTTSGTATSTYDYDYEGRRIQKSGPASALATYVWGGNGEMLEERPSGTASGSLRYEYLGSNAIGVGANRFIRDALGTAQGRVSTGSPTLYRYDAWGGFRGSTAAPVAGEPTLAYAGQFWDADAGLSYAQQRWYEPKTGRFLSEDPVFGGLQNPSSLQAFAYANGNPLTNVDPLGRLACDYQDYGCYTQEAEETEQWIQDCKRTGRDEKSCRDEHLKNEGLGIAGGAAVAVGVLAAPGIAAAAPAAATTVGANVGMAGGGAVVAEKAITIGVIALVTHDCWEHPSFTACSNAIAAAAQGWLANAPVRAGASSAPRSVSAQADMPIAEAPSAPAAGAAMPVALSARAEPLEPVSNAAASQPSVRYSRKAYGGAATNSPAAKQLRLENEGKPCPTCEEPQISGTVTAPSPQHEPPLFLHYEYHGGKEMTQVEREAYARSAEAFNGTQCLTCQRKEGAALAKESRALNKQREAEAAARNRTQGRPDEP
jgi:RHS repeat-associated protein